MMNRRWHCICGDAVAHRARQDSAQSDVPGSRWIHKCRTSTRIGFAFDEFIEPTSVFAGSIRLFDSAGNAIDGWGSGQETIGNYTPKEPLIANETYTVQVMQDGVQDLSGNTFANTFEFTFTTGNF